MRFQQQSYRARSLRPTPEVHLDEQSGLFIVATSWGNQDSGKKVVQMIAEFIAAAKDDSEVTSPFEVITCLSPLANDVRTALLLANESVYRNDNKDEYTVGLEVTVVAKRRSELCIGQVGNPSVFLKRKNSSIIPLSIGVDNLSTAPLPLHLLGIDSMISPHIASIRLTEADEFYFLSRSMTDTDVLKSMERNETLGSVAQNIVRIDSELPFWIGNLIDL